MLVVSVPARKMSNTVTRRLSCVKAVLGFSFSCKKKGWGGGGEGHSAPATPSTPRPSLCTCSIFRKKASLKSRGAVVGSPATAFSSTFLVKKSWTKKVLWKKVQWEPGRRSRRPGRML